MSSVEDPYNGVSFEAERPLRRQRNKGVVHDADYFASHSKPFDWGTHSFWQQDITDEKAADLLSWFFARDISRCVYESDIRWLNS